MGENQRYLAESQRLYLVPLTLEDHLEDFHELWVSEEAVRYATKQVKKNLEETAAWMPTIMNSAEQPDIDKFALLLKPEFDNPVSLSETSEALASSENQREGAKAGKKLKMIGIVGTNRWSDQGMETGYCLNERYWGRGLATEGFGLFLGWFWGLEERKHIPHLVAKVHPENLQSAKVVKKCGGREGVVLRGIEMKHGGWKGEKVDVCCWFFDRPGGNGVEQGEGT